MDKIEQIKNVLEAWRAETPPPVQEVLAELILLAETGTGQAWVRLIVDAAWRCGANSVTERAPFDPVPCACGRARIAMNACPKCDHDLVLTALESALTENAADRESQS